MLILGVCSSHQATKDKRKKDLFLNYVCALLASEQELEQKIFLVFSGSVLSTKNPSRFTVMSDNQCYCTFPIRLTSLKSVHATKSKDCCPLIS